jgi:hypothetical protein
VHPGLQGKDGLQYAVLLPEETDMLYLARISVIERFKGWGRFRISHGLTAQQRNRISGKPGQERNRSRQFFNVNEIDPEGLRSCLFEVAALDR